MIWSCTSTLVQSYGNYMAIQKYFFVHFTIRELYLVQAKESFVQDSSFQSNIIFRQVSFSIRSFSYSESYEKSDEIREKLKTKQVTSKLTWNRSIPKNYQCKETKQPRNVSRQKSYSKKYLTCGKNKKKSRRKSFVCFVSIYRESQKFCSVTFNILQVV